MLHWKGFPSEDATWEDEKSQRNIEDPNNICLLEMEKTWASENTTSDAKSTPLLFNF